MTYIIVFAILIAIPVALVMYIRPENCWNMLFGEADVGQTNFKTLHTQNRSNTALACPEGFCPDVKPDIVTPQFPVAVEKLRAEFRKSLENEQNVTRVHVNDAAFRERYVQRTSMLKFPETIQVEFIDLGYGNSSIALHSRSQFGFSDFGSNKRRLARWLKNLNEQAATNQARTFQRRMASNPEKIAAE